MINKILAVYLLVGILLASIRCIVLDVLNPNFITWENAKKRRNKEISFKHRLIITIWAVLVTAPIEPVWTFIGFIKEFKKQFKKQF